MGVLELGLELDWKNDRQGTLKRKKEGKSDPCCVCFLAIQTSILWMMLIDFDTFYDWAVDHVLDQENQTE
jgi:hypothetical protein